jgi:hypothetical protein
VATAVRRKNVSAGEWVEVVLGFVLPTAAVVFAVARLWRWSGPGLLKRPTGFVAGVAEFLLVCVLVMLVILGWEVFKTWRGRQHAAGSRSSVRVAPPDRTLSPGGLAGA